MRQTAEKSRRRRTRTPRINHERTKEAHLSRRAPTPAAAKATAAQERPPAAGAGQTATPGEKMGANSSQSEQKSVSTLTSRWLRESPLRNASQRTHVRQVSTRRRIAKHQISAEGSAALGRKQSTVACSPLEHERARVLAGRERGHLRAQRLDVVLQFLRTQATQESSEGTAFQSTQASNAQ